MRFEVAVGQTPRSLIEQEEAVGGSTPLSLVDAAQQLLIGGAKMMEMGVQDTSLDQQRLSTSPHNQSREDKSRSRLEVTLTAEPDKPIMVEVRGGEKQFLISALTRHIYDILSQPHRLALNNRDSGVSE